MLGYRLPRVVQTGSNFGSELAHDTPYLTTVGPGTMVSDGLTVMNADYTSTSFRVAKAELGEATTSATASRSRRGEGR